MPSFESILRVTRIAAVVVALGAATGPVGADEHAAPGADAQAAQMKAVVDAQLARVPSGDAGVDQILGGMIERLSLTTEQQQQVRPVVVEWVAKLEKARDGYVSGESNPMAFSMQLQAAGKAAAYQVEKSLTPEQVAEYRLMQQEASQEMAKANRQVQGASAATSEGDGE